MGKLIRLHLNEQVEHKVDDEEQEKEEGERYRKNWREKLKLKI